MATSSSTLLPKIFTKTLERPNLWFREYDHCLRFYINEGSVLRYKNHDVIDRVIARRKEWGRVMSHSPQPGSWAWRPLEITDQDLRNLHQMCDFFLHEKRTYKIMIFGNWVYIYTKDPTLLDDISRLDLLDPTQMIRTQLRLIGKPDTIVQKNPRYAKRSFFRNLSLSQNQKDSMFNFLATQDRIRISPALKHAMSSQYITRTMDYFFIDHNDDAVLIMLSLIVPNIIRKTLPITAYK